LRVVQVYSPFSVISSSVSFVSHGGS